MEGDQRNPLCIPVGGWIESGDMKGYARPTSGTAAALIELYRGRNGGKEAETIVSWCRWDPSVHFSSDRGPDVISVLKRSGDDGIVAFRPPMHDEDTLFMYLAKERTRRPWAIVRATRRAGEEESQDQDEAEEEED